MRVSVPSRGLVDETNHESLAIVRFVRVSVPSRGLVDETSFMSYNTNTPQLFQSPRGD